ncbi:MAG: MFS transporter [Dehalococcoidia bacterium]|nr:MFS transporter [Dehalococcoidia bacterium]
MRSRFLTGLWAKPDFVRLWAGTTTSTFGSLIGQIALSFTAITFLDATAPEVAVLGASQLVPGFLVSPFAGVWVDRLRRRPIMITADLGRAAALATVPLAAVSGGLTMYQLFAVGAVTSVLSVFFAAAYQSYLPTLVERKELLEGNAKLAGTASVAEVASFSLSGWLVQLLKAPGAVAIDAASFVVSAYFVWRIKEPEAEIVRDPESEHFWREAKEGARVVASDGVLRGLAVAEALQAMGEKVLTTVYLLYLVGELGFSAGVLGMIFAVGGVTSLGGAWVANRGTLFLGRVGATIIAASFMRATGAVFMALPSDSGWLGVLLLVLAQFVTDPFWTLHEIHDVSLRQAITPERVQGRMFANFRLLNFGFAVLGTVLGGVLGSVIGFRETLFVAVGLMYLSSIAVFLSPVRGVKRPAEGAA